MANKNINVAPGVDPRKGQEDADADELYASFDVEWTRHPTNPLKNVVLVYGWRIEFKGKSKTFLFYPKGNDARSRLAFSTMLGNVIVRSMPDVLEKFPKRIVVVGHYARGDLAACKDFPVIKRRFDSVNGSFVSSNGPANVEVELCPKTGLPIEMLQPLPDGREIRVMDEGENRRSIAVTFRDTSLLAVGDGKSLDELGALVGLPKVELPAGYDKSRMDLLFADRREDAELYLRRDLEIPLRYFRRIEKVMAGIGVSPVPPTLGAAAISKFMSVLKQQTADDGSPITPDRFFSIERTSKKVYSRASGRYRTISVSAISIARGVSEYLMAKSYQGGRTEVYETGPSEPGAVLNDIDMKSAYPTAQIGLRLADFERTFNTTDPREFTADRLGAAEVEFDSPASLEFPVFTVKTNHGLVSPLRGETVATSPEIAAAVHLGVAINIKRGVIIPWTSDQATPVLQFTRDLTAARDRYKETQTLPSGREIRVDTLESLAVKTITNSLYGKMGQGVHPTNVFDSRTGLTRPLGGSPVSCAAFAAYTTGVTRAAIAEMINRIPAHRRVVSVSTDGFLTDATIDEIDVSGPACRVLSANRALIDGNPALLEYKKHALQVVTARSRAVFTALGHDGSRPILARGSVKVPHGTADPNDFLLGLYLDRMSDTLVARKDMISFRAQWLGNTDLVTIDRETRINFEPDFKRDLVEPRLVAIASGSHQGREHLATRSKAYETAEAMIEQRTLFEGWRYSTGRCFKTMADWDDLFDYRESVLAARAAGRRSHRTAGGSADDLKRLFLRAGVRGMWGIGFGARNYREVAEWLSAAGYTTSREAIKNACRADRMPYESSIAATPKTVALLAVILRSYPDFDYSKAFVHGHLVKIRDEPVIAKLERERARLRLEGGAA